MALDKIPSFLLEEGGGGLPAELPAGFGAGTGENSIVEGLNTVASGDYSHAEGENTQALEVRAHSEGIGTISSGDASHAEGEETESSGMASHSEGYNTQAFGHYSHAEGDSTLAYDYTAHTEGGYTTAGSEWTHAEGLCTNAQIGETYRITNSTSEHLQGVIEIEPLAFGINSLTVGDVIAIITDEDIAEINNITILTLNNKTITIDTSKIRPETFEYMQDNFHPIAWTHIVKMIDESHGYAPIHAEGYGTLATGQASHAEGYRSKALGQSAHSEGYETLASGINSHSQNEGTIAQGKGQTAIGTYNIAQGTVSSYSNNDYLFIVGNGIDEATRSNALTIDRMGNVNIPVGANYKINGVSIEGGSGSLSALTTTKMYYISATGSDSNDGLTESTPLQTMQAVLNKIDALAQVTVSSAYSGWSGGYNIFVVLLSDIVEEGDIYFRNASMFNTLAINTTSTAFHFSFHDFVIVAPGWKVSLARINITETLDITSVDCNIVNVDSIGWLCFQCQKGVSFGYSTVKGDGADAYDGDYLEMTDIVFSDPTSDYAIYVDGIDKLILSGTTIPSTFATGIDATDCCIDISSNTFTNSATIPYVLNNCTFRISELPNNSIVPSHIDVTTTKTLSFIDMSTFQICDSASTIYIDIPDDTALDFPIDTEITFSRFGNGDVTFRTNNSTIVSINNYRSINGLYSEVKLKKIGDSRWWLTGDLKQ